MENVLPLRPLEALLNRAIADSATAAAIAAGLEGQVLGVTIAGTSLDFRLAVEQGQVALCAGDAPAADATISGPPLALLGMLRGDPLEQARSGQIRIAGNTEVAEQFRALLLAAQPDLEEEAAKLVGDVLAHQLGRLARAGQAWFAEAAESLGRSVSEYLREERRSLPTRVEVERWAAAVDELRSDVDRAAARVERLLQQAHSDSSR